MYRTFVLQVKRKGPPKKIAQMYVNEDRRRGVYYNPDGTLKSREQFNREYPGGPPMPQKDTSWRRPKKMPQPRIKPSSL